MSSINRKRRQFLASDRYARKCALLNALEGKSQFRRYWRLADALDRKRPPTSSDMVRIWSTTGLR